jgi:hypothetical protein
MPVYFFMPCLPYDPDPAKMFSEERVFVALAAACGFL